MNIDFARPFQYVFEDKDWVKKVLLGGAVVFASILGIFLLVIPGLIGFCALAGYQRRVALAVADGRENPLPELGEWGEDIKNGFCNLGIGFVWALPGILIGVLGFVAGLVLSNASEDAGAMVIMASMCIRLPVQLAGVIFAFLGIIRFYETGEFGSAFRVGELLALGKSQAINILLGFVIMMVAAIAAEIVGFIACGIGILFTLFWAQVFVGGHVFGQIIKLNRASSGAPAPIMRPAMR